MTGKLRFNDVVSFSYLNPNWTKVKDDYEGAFKPPVPGQPHSGAVGNIPEGDSPQTQQTATNGLNVQIAATHSGIVIRNNRFYLPERMKKGVATFTKDFFKPVLLHHDQDKDPVGRVIDAAYVDTSGVIQDKYRGLEVKNSAGKTVGTINDAMIQDFVTDKMPFGQQVDVIRNMFRDSLLEDDEYTGLGYIKILANIADPDAIQKLLDGRYITGSVGASTNRAVCSICKSDWAKEGKCDHKPGAIYDEAKCFLIAGDLSYEEYSFVNVPADRLSKVLQLDYNGNSYNIDVVDDYKGRIHEVQLQFPQYDSVPKEEKGMANKDAKTNDDLEIQDNVDVNADPAPDAEPQQTGGAQDVADSANEEGASSEETVQDNTETTEQVEDNKKEEEVKDFVATVIEVEDALSNEDEEAFYGVIWDEVLAALKDGEFTLEQLGAEKIEDAKLSTEKRKKLPKSSFCGPNKSFPVPDCAHVTAARRLVNRYKGEGDKSAILACVSRKAKAMGCETKSKDSVQGEVEDNYSTSRVMHMLIEAMETSDYKDGESVPVFNEDELKALQSVLKRLATLVGKDNLQQALYTEELAHDESSLLDEVISLEEKVGDLRDRLDASQKEYHLLFADMEEVQDSLVSEKEATRKTKEGRLKDLTILRDHKVDEVDYTSLSDSDLDSEIVRMEEIVDMVKIADKLGDGMSRIPEGDVDDPSGIQDQQNQKSKITVQELQQIQQDYMYLKFQPDGQRKAEMYIADLRERGLLPRDFDDIEGGSN